MCLAADAAKVRNGKVGVDKQELSPGSRAAIKAAWDEVVLPATGCTSYSEMLQVLDRELGRSNSA